MYLLSKAIMNSELNIDYTLLPENVPAICVPYVFDNILEQRMMGIFNALSIGEVCRIDEVPYTDTNGKKVKRVFVHLKWKIDPTANKIRTKLLCGKKVKVLYDDPWFWEISASRAKETPQKRDPAPVQSKKPRIDLDDDIVPRPKTEVRPKHKDYRPKPTLQNVQPTQILQTDLPIAPGLMPMSLMPPQTSIEVDKFVPTTPPTPPLPEDEDEEFPALPRKNLCDLDQAESTSDFEYSSNLPTNPPEKKKRVTKKTTTKDKGPDPEAEV